MTTTTHYSRPDGRPLCGSPEDTIGGIVTCPDCQLIATTAPLEGHGFWYSMRDYGCDCRARFTSRAEHAAHVAELRAAVTQDG